jgi:anti-sigma B factor antagonist
MLNTSVPQAGQRVLASNSAPFSCLRAELGNAVCVVVAGELDMATAPLLDASLGHAEADASTVVLDLRRLSFMDCSGLRVVLEANRRVRQAGGGFVVVRGPASVDRLFMLVDAARELDFSDQPPTETAQAKSRVVPQVPRASGSPGAVVAEHLIAVTRSPR